MQSQVKRRIVFGLTTGGLLATGGIGFAQADATSTGTGDAGTTTAGSPGVLSGNTIQIPVDVPINVCGVTANVVGLLNPAAGNQCSNSGGASASGGGTTASGGATATGSSVGSPGVLSGNTVQVPVDVPVNVCGDTVNVVGLGDTAAGNHCHNVGGSSTAIGGSAGSPGVGSGNTIQFPISVPVNLCGDSVNVVGIGNGAEGNSCANTTPPSTPPTSAPSTPPTITPTPPTHNWVAPHPAPAETGGETPATTTGTLAHTGAEGLMLAPVGAALIGGGAFMYRKFKPGRSH